ncbi:MAG TPA: PilZ domain-containing protein [Solirubrobacteraceae bacterium]|nr:PilZ domain-containing protein [Solirubrobacteraceae bacterium]
MGDQGLDAEEYAQRRAAFRVALRLPVWVEYPAEVSCELQDISLLGASIDCALPCDFGDRCEFVLVTEDFGTVPLTGQVVRTGQGSTALRFIETDHQAARAVRDLVSAAQRRELRNRSRVGIGHG